ncbi:MAG: ATP-grasp domain-containing protein [Bacilli bacterium]|nr:ATP-grasp domain-containing protein [Bacilli bacterium]MDD4808652.1 ATP-grasp domain-containing protein [Bacilli bacterium]
MDFDVLLIGTDMNAYYMARCYHEKYNRKANIIGKQEMPFTSLSSITNVSIIPNLSDSKVFTDTLIEYAKKHNDKKIILIGTNDAYVRLIVENEELLKEYFLFNYPRLDIIDNVLVKDNFYEAFKDSCLDLPKTYIYSCKEKDEINEVFDYPLILKAGNGVEYYNHPFEGMSKVYKIKTKEELYEVIKKIEDSGYEDNLIIQEFIPGDDTALFDSIFYCSKDKEVQLMTFAQIGLQERTHTGVGNCTVLVNGFDENGYKEEVIYNLKKFMEEIGFQGFAEFDLKYDYRDGKYKVLEINPRQARSSYYLAACGHNLIEYLVDDLIYHKKKEPVLMKDKMVLSFVPTIVMNKYVTSPKLKSEIKKLVKEGKFCRPLHYKGDKCFKRKVYLLLKDVNYYRKYKNLEW